MQRERLTKLLKQLSPKQRQKIMHKIAPDTPQASADNAPAATAAPMPRMRAMSGCVRCDALFFPVCRCKKDDQKDKKQLQDKQEKKPAPELRVQPPRPKPNPELASPKLPAVADQLTLQKQRELTLRLELLEQQKQALEKQLAAQKKHAHKNALTSKPTPKPAQPMMQLLPRSVSIAEMRKRLQKRLEQQFRLKKVETLARQNQGKSQLLTRITSLRPMPSPR